MSEERIREAAKVVLSTSGADQLEVTLLQENQRLTRFANNEIHQNVAHEDVQVRVRAIRGKKIGTAKVNSLNQQRLKWATRKAIDTAPYGVENDYFTSLPSPQRWQPIQAHFPSTEEVSARRRADVVREVVDKARRSRLSAAGALSVRTRRFGVFNSLGVDAYHPSTWVRLTSVVSSQDSSGYSEAGSPDFECVHPARVADESISKCVKGRHPVEVEPGRYDVFLEEYALSEIFNWLAWIGMGARSFQEESSFMYGRIGENIMAEKVTVWDDGADPDTFSLPFDFEGVPRRKVTIVERGVARGVVYDTLTAARGGSISTGHALPPEYSLFGPLPLHLHMAAGPSSKASIISSIEKGVMVTRFHYINGLLKPREALFTGMTRDGTFLIENGKLTTPLKNLRFTESMLRAFTNVAEISKERRVLGGDDFSTFVLPAVWIKDFNFTGRTEF